MVEKIKSFLFKNTTARQTVAKNTFWLSVTNFGGRAIKSIIVLYAARALDTSGYGIFSYAITLAGFFTLFLDPGINAMVMREIPKANDAGRKSFLSTTFFLKVILVATGIPFVLFVAPLFTTLPGAKALLPIVAIVISIDTFREFFSSFMRAQEKMEWETETFILTNIVIVIAGFLYLSLSPTPTAFAWAYVTGTVAGLLLAVWLLRRYIGTLFTQFSKHLVSPIIRSAWPFAITSALGALLTSADVLIISWFRSASDVGIYAAAVRIVQVLYLVPTIFQFSTLPLIARLAGKDDERFRTIFERTMAMIFLASVPLALGGVVLGSSIMRFVFGTAYASGGLSFKILMATMIFDFPVTVISTAIFAYNRQKNLIVSAAIAGILNTGLDLLFIPLFGIAGSAAATLIAQAAVNWYLWRVMDSINPTSVLSKLKRIGFAGIVMTALTILLKAAGTELLVNILASAAAYLILLKLLNEPLIDEALRSIGIGASRKQAA